MNKKIEELARELLKNILEKYHNRGDWDTRSLSKMVEDELKNYNEKVRYLIENELFNILGGFYFKNTNREIAVTPLILSDMLYKNAKDVSKTTTKILKDAIKAKKTIRELAKDLYEGYGFRDKEPLDLIDKYALPKYIKDELKNPKNIKKVMKQIEKLKTKPLRIAYKKIFRELDNKSYDGVENALYTATQEKARYYANRIAQTEISRASNSKWAKEMLEDEEVEFVKYRLSTAHKIKDICDFYAHLDLGYGEGIYPKSDMRTLPLHPHCSCTYDPYYREVRGKRKSWDKAVKETMSNFREYEQRQILGSKEKLKEFRQGKDIEKIFNSIRPKYPIKKYVDLFGKMSENFKEDLLKLGKIGYFDEQFKELKIEDICKKIEVDKRDLDEIIKKTKFKIEGAVYYKNNNERVFIKGGENYIDVPFSRYIKKFIHSHPRGTSFSAEDIEMAIENRIAHIVAFNDIYVYSLKFENFNFDFDKEFIKSFEKYDKILVDKVKRGGITSSQKDFAINHKVWKDLFKNIKGVKYDYFRIRK